MLPNATQKLGESATIFEYNQRQTIEMARGMCWVVGARAKVYLCLFIGLGAAAQ